MEMFWMEGFDWRLTALNIACVAIMAAYMVHTAKRILGNFTQGRPFAACDKDDSILPPAVLEGIYGGIFIAALLCPPLSLSVARLACFYLFISLLYWHIRNKDTENRYGAELKKQFTRLKISGAVVFLCILIRLL